MEMKTFASCAAMVFIQLAYGVANILLKVAFDKGLNQLVFMLYRHIIALCILGPFAYALERKQRPPLSFILLTKLFVLTSLGTTISLNLYYIGLRYTSPTVAGAMSNVTPALTFLMAVLLRMEKVSLRSKRGQAKVFGTVICIGGSLAFTFWKGGYKFKPILEKALIHFYGKGMRHDHENWIMGSSFILASKIAWSAWLILQAKVYIIYPARLSMNAWICFFASLQSFAIATFFSHDPALWRLEWNIQLVAIIYGGVVASALVYYLQIWCISNRGPVFVSMFNPLLLLITAVFSAFAFAEQLYLSSFVGALLIIIGLYCVLWGKSEQSKPNDPEKGSDGKNEGLELYTDTHCNVPTIVETK